MKYRAKPVEVEAFAILSVSPPIENGTVRLLLENDTSVEATPDMTARFMPKSGDFWVIQNDGYTYLNPRHVFERKYEPIA